MLNPRFFVVRRTCLILLLVIDHDGCVDIERY